MPVSNRCSAARSEFRHLKRVPRVAAALSLALALTFAPVGASAQELLSGGDAAVTVFSGLARGADGSPRPNPDGAVVRLLNLGDLAVAADGALREAPRVLLSRTARDVGQVFGIAFDDSSPANIYLAASSAFGLYRTPNGGWPDGMWGPGGGPGTIWKLDAARGYRAERFADIGYLDAPNGGAGLGDLAYDPWHSQLFVSDLESGLVHRLDLDGELLESFDHGVDGRAFFFDAATGEDVRGEPVMHDPASTPRFEDCAVEFEGVEDAMPFDSAPECWNYADFRRRVWGLGVFRDGDDGDVRLYYAVWGGAALGNREWDAAGEDAATSLWSIALTEDGWFDSTDVRREIVLPPLAETGERRPESAPVTSIAFTDEGEMVLAERGRPAPYFEEAEFTQLVEPQGARVLRLSQAAGGAWQIDGRFAVGYPQREDPPNIRANAAGGVAVPDGQGLIWMSAERLCSEAAPCPEAQTGERTLSDLVGGIQAMPAGELLALDAADEEADLETAYLFSVRGAGRVVGDMGSLAMHPGEAPPVRIVERPERRQPIPREPDAPEPSEPEDVAEPEIEEPDEPEDVVEPRQAEVAPTDLAVAKRGLEECRPDEDCRFEVELANEGDDTFAAPLLITDTLGASGVSLVSSTPEAWACHSANGHVFCRNDRLTLGPEQSVTLSLTLRVPSGHRQPRLENCAAITWLGRAGRDRIRAVQAELNRRGHDAGPVDGAMGPRTQSAIREVEAGFGLAESGEISAELIEAMFGEGAYMSGDGQLDNDRACATATVDVPPPPAPTASPTTPPAPPSAAPPPAQAQEPPRAHARALSEFHQRRASAQHNPATSAPTAVHQQAFSQFHMRYRSSQHDGARSQFVGAHHPAMSQFHQRFQSQMHDIETSGPRQFHSLRDSTLRDRHDGVTSRMRGVHEPWSSRWR